MIGFSVWPERQLLHDLTAVARAAIAGAPDGLAPLVDVPGMQLAPEGEYLATLARLNEAWNQGGPVEAAFALSVLLADAIHGQVGPDGADFGWPDWTRHLPGMPRPWAAALVRAVEAAGALQYRALAPEPAPEQRLSEDSAAVIAPLVALARRLDEDMIRSVALADYGWKQERHAAALRDVLAHPACRFPKGERWYPAEVVELTGHDPENGATFLPCIALLVLDDLHNGGDYDQMTFRWMRNADLFLTAPEDFRGPILRGIRHVMEREPVGGWDPYFDWKSVRKMDQARHVPWLYDDLPMPPLSRDS